MDGLNLSLCPSRRTCRKFLMKSLCLLRFRVLLIDVHHYRRQIKLMILITGMTSQFRHYIIRCFATGGASSPVQSSAFVPIHSLQSVHSLASLSRVSTNWRCRKFSQDSVPGANPFGWKIDWSIFLGTSSSRLFHLPYYGLSTPLVA